MLKEIVTVPDEILKKISDPIEKDGIKVSEKYENMLDINKSNIPTDIEVMINDGEIAMILLRLVEIIGIIEKKLIEDLFETL